MFICMVCSSWIDSTASFTGTIGFGNLMNHSLHRGVGGVKRLLDTGASLVIRLERLPWCFEDPELPATAIMDLQRDIGYVFT